MEERFVTDKDVAHFLGGVNPKTINLWARAGRIPSYKVGKIRRYLLSEISKCIREGKCQ